ncbi:hypothetical protein EW146_g5708 [Bondarzewia mesenterica]|uniref:Uncharacterized protein n=1 Tax=Bondarzewia mesenterica TaxID=1095465 RepID=A0A4S4LQQ4_9AGAM|nr:hypothetical protein EW146_g5708 [Bondarzewia mesenterica]
MGIPLGKAEFLALFLETFAYGTFFTLCSITVFILLRNYRDSTRKTGFLLTVALLMLVLATAHLSIDFVRAFDAFAVQHSENGADGYYDVLSNPLFVAKTFIYWAQTLLGDGVIIWHCYVIYAKCLLVVVPPILFVFLAFAAGIIDINTLMHSKLETTIFMTVPPWISTFFVATLLINVYCTFMISWRIYTSISVSFPSGSGFGAGNLFPAMIVIIESGALYTSSIVAFLCTYLAHSNGQYPAMDLIAPLVGIVYCLIILQVRLHVGSSVPSEPSSSDQIHWAMRTSSSFVTPPTSQAGMAYPTTPITIEGMTHVMNNLSLYCHHHLDTPSQGTLTGADRV